MYRTRQALALLAAGAGAAALLSAPLAAADTLLPDCGDPGNQAVATECPQPDAPPSFEGEEDAFYGFPGFDY